MLMRVLDLPRHEKTGLCRQARYPSCLPGECRPSLICRQLIELPEGPMHLPLSDHALSRVHSVSFTHVILGATKDQPSSVSSMVSLI